MHEPSNKALLENLFLQQDIEDQYFQEDPYFLTEKGLENPLCRGLYPLRRGYILFRSVDIQCKPERNFSDKTEKKDDEGAYKEKFQSHTKSLFLERSM
jgi:hypothetical protein